MLVGFRFKDSDLGFGGSGVKGIGSSGLGVKGSGV